MELVREDLEKFNSKLQDFIKDDTIKSITLSKKDLKIMCLVRYMYLQNKQDKGIQYANKLITQALNKMITNIDSCITMIENF